MCGVEVATSGVTEVDVLGSANMIRGKFAFTIHDLARSTSAWAVEKEAFAIACRRTAVQGLQTRVVG